MLNETYIKNRDYLLQAVDFASLKFGTITPTDIDGLIEYRGRCFVFFEIKHTGAALPMGQRIALERLVDNSKVPAIAFVASHNSVGDIDAGNCEVSLYYMGRGWARMKKYRYLREAAEAFLKKYGGYKP